MSNMAVRAAGCPKQFLQLHLTTTRKMEYHAFTKFGASEQYGQHMLNVIPLWGYQQGGANSPPKWCLVSRIMIRAYNRSVPRKPIKSPEGGRWVVHPGVSAFVDDSQLTVVFDSDPTMEEMKCTVQ